MVSLESYELNYSIFLAEQEMFDRLCYYGSGVVNESIGLISVNEGVKETVMKYLEKISDAFQKAWEKFKDIVTRKADQIYLKSIAKKINEVDDPGFEILGYKNYDLNRLNSIKLIPFNYEDMKPYLDNKEAFINRYYNELAGKSISEEIEKMVVTSQQDTKCTKEILQSMYKFLTSEFTNEFNRIEQDLKTVNTSNRNIEQMVSTISSAETTNEAATIYEYYLSEDTVKFKDDPDRKSSDNTTLVKHVTVYMNASSDVLSAKMKILRDVYAQNMKTIKHFIKPPKENQEQSEESKDNQTSPEIQIET